jgi:hypothetical protein
MEITKISVWNKKDTRVYITYINEESQSVSGCFYKDGNDYQGKGTLENMTEEVLLAAKKICSEHKGKSCYCTMYESDIKKEITKTKSYRYDSKYNEMKRDIAKGYPVNMDDYND